MQRLGVLVLAVALVAAACGGSGEGAAATDAPPRPTTTSAPAASSTTSVPTTTAPAATTTTAPPGPVLIPRVSVSGPEEMVFDWSTDRCEDENIPDIASRAFRDAEGRVQLIIGHYVNYRMVGPDLDEVEMDCSGPVLRSDFDPDPSQFDDSEWIGGLYTQDGETVYALVHNEYRGDTHGRARPDQCPSGDRFTCLDTSITLAVSTDGGATFDHAVAPPGHMVATLPYVFDDEGLPTGLRQVSNIIRGPGDHYYAFSNVSDYPDEEQWVCLMRTEDLADPAAWRYWTGRGFTGEFTDPYLEPGGSDTCAPLALPQLDSTVQEAVVYDEALGEYVLFGTSFSPGTPEPHWGVYYSLSDDLIHWSTRRLLVELPSYGSVDDYDNDSFYAYVSVLDPDSESMSFETTDGGAYLYITRFNAGTHSLDRDLMRFPIELGYVEAEAPEWTFDTDGDTEGWQALFDLSPLDAVGGSLVMESTGSDPYFGSGPLQIPAGFDRLTIRMRVSAGADQTGQVFFGTDADPAHTEEASLVFDVVGDGEFHEYELDLSTVAAWEGMIVSLRVDPAAEAGRTIEVDRIWFEG